MNEAAVAAAKWVSEWELRRKRGNREGPQGAFVNCVILIRVSWGRKSRAISNRETAGWRGWGVKKLSHFFVLFLTKANDYVGKNAHD